MTALFIPDGEKIREERVTVTVTVTTPLVGETRVTRGCPSSKRIAENSKSDIVSAMRVETRDALALLAQATAAVADALTETE